MKPPHWQLRSCITFGPSSICLRNISESDLFLSIDPECRYDPGLLKSRLDLNGLLANQFSFHYPVCPSGKSEYACSCLEKQVYSTPVEGPTDDLEQYFSTGSPQNTMGPLWGSRWSAEPCNQRKYTWGKKRKLGKKCLSTERFMWDCLKLHPLHDKAVVYFSWWPDGEGFGQQRRGSAPHLNEVGRELLPPRGHQCGQPPPTSVL